MVCSKCLQEKDPTDFSFRSKKTGKRHNSCKSCHADYRKHHYIENKNKYIKKAMRWNLKQREVLRAFLLDTLLKSKCIDCGEDDIVVLDFDHVAGKKFGIALMFRNRFSVAAIRNEIKKCVIRCANCHRRKTSRELGHWKSKVGAKIGA